MNSVAITEKNWNPDCSCDLNTRFYAARRQNGVEFLDHGFAFSRTVADNFSMRLPIFALFTFGLSSAFGAEWGARHSIELSPQYRLLHQDGFHDFKEVYDVFAVVNSHFEWSRANTFVEVKPEVRALMSRGIRQGPPAEVSAMTSPRFFHARRTLVSRPGHPGHEAYFDFDRINIRQRLTHGEWFLGRRPVSLGVLRYFPVWNKLTMPLVFQPGPEWIQNPDVIGGSLQLDPWTWRAFASRSGDAGTDDLALLTARYAGEGFEMHALAGTWWLHTAAGLAAAFDILESTLRLEWLWLSHYGDEPSQSQFGLGFERALDEKWTVLVESLYQTEGLQDVSNSLTPPNRFMTLSGRYYLLPNISYQIHPLWQVRAGILSGFGTHESYVGLSGFEYSYSDNTIVTLKIKWPFGASTGEFGPERIRDPLGRSAGSSSTVILQLQSTF